MTHPTKLATFLKRPAFTWTLVIALFVVILLGIVLTAFGVNIISIPWFFELYLILPIIFLVIHSIKVLSGPRALFFLGLSFVLGFVSEWSGVRSGILFGSRYSYVSGPYMTLGVPIVVPLYWAALTYTSYSVVNSFLRWKNIEKPNRERRNFFTYVFLVFCDAVVICALDALLDPVAVALHTWKWEAIGGYFGVPYKNFLAWAFITIVITGIFRIYEYFKPKNTSAGSSLLTIPVFAYGLLSILLAIEALRLHLFVVAGVGLVLTLSIVVANTYFFVAWVKRKYPRNQFSSERKSNYLRSLIEEILR